MDIKFNKCSCKMLEDWIDRWNTTKILHYSWNNVGSMWQNMMGVTCRSELIKFWTKLSMVLRSPYINYERSTFSISLSQSNSWFLFGSSLEYSSLF
jgi:hypothetical protein